MEIINIDDFKKIEIRAGKILTAERVEGSDKLVKLEVDFGSETVKIPAEGDNPEKDELKPIKRQIVAGIGKVYEPEFLVGKESIFVFNLAPRSLKGIESQGMILCASSDDKPILLSPIEEVLPGSIIK